MSEVLAELVHVDFQLDGTYEAVMKVLGQRDWRYFAFYGTKFTDDIAERIQRHAALQKRLAARAKSRTKHAEEHKHSEDEYEEATDDNDGRIVNHQMPRTLRKHGGVMSTAQLVISDEYELVHAVCPINGV
jgi:hypothetical protein